MLSVGALAVLHLAVTALPCVAAAIVARNRGITDPVIVIALAVAAGGVFAYLTFWGYVAARDLGIALSIAVPIASLTYIVAAVPDLRAPEEPLRQLIQPLLLWVFGSVFILALGFLHGGMEGPIGMASTRFSGQLPTDNDIPFYFASQLFNGASPLAAYPGDWLSSDRPPLQIGYILTQMGPGELQGALSYQVHAVILQQTWLIGFWALLTAAGVSSRTRALALIAALVTDVTIVNGFYVWPKLLPATFLLLALSLVFSSRWSQYRYDLRVAGLLATLIGLSLLAHGGGVFGVLPIIMLALYKGIPSWRWIGIALLTGLVFMGSWAVYQRAIDPPGDRLVKWHLGGVVEVTDESVPAAILRGYKEAGLKGTLDNKLANVDEVIGVSHVRLLGPGIRDAVASGNARSAIEATRWIRFFSTLPALGFLILAPIIMLFGAGRRRSQHQEQEWRFGVWTLLLAAAGILAWVLIAFGGPDAVTTIHVGSLSLPLMLIAGGVAGMMSVSPRLATAVVLINVLTVLLLYVPSFTPVPETSYSGGAAIIAAVGLAGFIAASIRAGSSPRAAGGASGAPSVASPIIAAREMVLQEDVEHDE